MADNCDTYDINHKVDVDQVYKNKINVDVPSTATSALSEIDSTTSSWDYYAPRAVSALFSDTCRRLSTYIQPVLASDIYDSAFSESVPNSMGCIAESIKPLASSCAMDGMTKAVECPRDSISDCFAVGQVFKNTAAASIVLPAKNIFGSMTIDSGARSALGNTMKNPIAKSAQSLITNNALESISSIASATREAINASAELTRNMIRVAHVAVESVRPVQTALSVWTKKFMIRYDLSKLFSAITLTIDSGIFMHFSESVGRMSNLMHFIWQQSGYCLQGLVHLLFSLLYSRWKRRSKLLSLPGSEAIKQAAVLVNTGLSPPHQVCEFVVRIRQAYLLKHQRINDDSANLNNSFLLILERW